MKAQTQVHVHPKDREEGGSPDLHPTRYIYQKNIAVSQPAVVSGDRFIVTIERRFGTHWTCREVDAPSDRVPQVFTVIPHKDLIPFESNQSVLPEPEVRIDINQCQPEELVRSCPGIGAAAHWIVERRPKTGYQSLAYLKQLNSDLPIDWIALNSRISFTPVTRPASPS